jgi:hypothetical protein
MIIKPYKKYPVETTLRERAAPYIPLLVTLEIIFPVTSKPP